MRNIPTHLSLILSETSTFYVLDLPSSTELKNTEEGDLAEEDNQRYEYLTAGKGRNRKVINAEIQTIPLLLKSRTTQAKTPKKANNYAFASNWDMFDTFEQNDSPDAASKTVKSSTNKDNIHDLHESTSCELYKMSMNEKHCMDLIKNPRFFDAVVVIERLLANNCFNEQQKIFRGLILQDCFRDDIKYQYRLNLLWTFRTPTTEGDGVNSMQWNPRNTDILAVGYGKFYYLDLKNSTGLVLIWNIKNPVQPERRYDLPSSVISVQFSRENPNYLAVGMYSGYIYVINIARRDLHVIAKVNQDVLTLSTPVTKLLYMAADNNFQNEEQLVASFLDGRICTFHLTRSAYLKSQQIMRVINQEGTLNGIPTTRTCSTVTVPISRYAGALCMRTHPTDKNLYFVGTSDGVVHICSTNYLNQHLDQFLAHECAINQLKFSPFSDKIFATCGDDWYFRIWAHGITEPLIEVADTIQYVVDLDWSPTHSTILAVAKGNSVHIYDMQRQIFTPQSVTVSQTKSKILTCEFTANGRCLIVGDIDGNVNIFSLEDMPFSPFFQEDLLYQSLKKALITKPDITNKLDKIRTNKYGEV